jgi:uncharacterized protein
VQYIDAFNHFFPQRFFAGVLETPAAQKDMGKRIRGIPALWDLEERLNIVDSFPDYSQILSLAMPAIDRLWDAEHAPEWARIGNDELAELVAKYPKRFPGYAASLPMNAPEAAAREAERVLSSGANVIQLHTNVNGAPIDQDAFLPIYEIIERSGRPILLHPIRTREMADYRTETTSKYEINSVIGWPFETGRRWRVSCSPGSWTGFRTSRSSPIISAASSLISKGGSGTAGTSWARAPRTRIMPRCSSA